MPILESELTAEVLGNLEIDSTDLTRFKIYEHLNQAQDWLVGILPFKELIDVVVDLLIDSVSGQANYTWPDGTLYSTSPEFARFYEMYISTVSITRAAPGNKAFIYDRDIHTLPITEYGTADIPFVDPDGDSEFIVHPIPAGGSPITDFLRLLYVPKLTRIAAAVNCTLNYRLKNLIIYRATRLSALIEEYRPEQAKEYMTLETNELAKFRPKSAQST